MRFWPNIREDYLRLTRRQATLFRMIVRFLSDAGFRAVWLYRMGHACRNRKLGLVAVLLQRFMLHLCHCSISVNAVIGPGFSVRHVGDIVVGGATAIGRNCDIRQDVTFGGNAGRERDDQTQPRVGDDVTVGAGAKILGPVCIGHRVFIGANSVVVSDIPSDAVVDGVPARVIRCQGQPVPLIEQSGSLAHTLKDMLVRLQDLESKVERLGQRFNNTQE